MKYLTAACTVLLMLCGCATKKPAWEPPIVAVRVTFRSHLSIVRSCESRGVTPTLDAAKAAGANLALVFAPPTFTASGTSDPQHAGDDAIWIPVREKPAGIAGVRAFRCPVTFVEKVTAAMNRPPEAPK